VQPGDLPESAYGVFCTESADPRDPGSYPRQARVADLAAPAGLGAVWTGIAEPCAQWPVRDAERYTGPFDRPTVPLLVIGTLGDPTLPTTRRSR
jgi:hypothetical protein